MESKVPVSKWDVLAERWSEAIAAARELQTQFRILHGMAMDAPQHDRALPAAPDGPEADRLVSR